MPEKLWAVVVVHGVGETSPGNTLEMLAPAYLKRNPRLSDLGMPEIRMLPDPQMERWPDEEYGIPKAPPPPAPDDDLQAQDPLGPRSEPDPHDRPNHIGLADRFPVHLRWVGLPAGGNGPEKAVFAEVFWADLSDTRPGLWQLVVRLFTVIFHLRFLADRGADLHSGIPGGSQTSRPARLQRSWLFIAGWLLCGPIAALTALMFYYPIATFVLDWALRVLEWGYITPATIVGGDVSFWPALGAAALWIFVALCLTLLWAVLRPNERIDPQHVYRWRWISWRIAGSSGFLIVLSFPLYRLLAHKELSSIGWLSLAGCVILLSERKQGGRRFFQGIVVFLGFSAALAWLLVHHVPDSRHEFAVALVGTFASGAESAPLAVAAMVSTQNALDTWREQSVLVQGLLASGTALLLAWRASRRKWGSPWKLVFLCIAAFGFPLPLLVLLLGRARTLELVVPRYPDLFLTYFAGLLWLMQLVFSLLGISLVAAFVSWAIAWRLHDSDERRSLSVALGAAFLQVGLWSLLVPMLSMLALRTFYAGMVRDESLPFAGVMIGFVWHFLLAILVVLPIGWILAKRRLWVWRNRPDFVDPDGIPRILVNSWIVGAVIVAGLFGGLLLVCRHTIGRWPLDHLFFALAGYLATGVAVLLPIVSPYFREGLQAGLHIVMDVIAHFYQRGLNFPWPFGAPVSLRLRDFIVQMRLEARFRRVLQEVLFRLVHYKITDLTIVAHSQGTMIAIDTLWYAWTHRLLKENPNHPDVTVRLATMGSPFTYLYHDYYPARYPNLFDATGQIAPGWTPWNQGQPLPNMTLDKTVDEWINLYRVDDFIGMRIEGRAAPDFPKNIPVGTGGHTYYWHEERVLDELQRVLPA